MHIVCVGNLNFDLTFVVERLPEPHEKLRSPVLFSDCGGAAGNTAFWLAKLGASVRMLACIGADELGVLAIESLRSVGVDTRFIQRTDAASTGAAAILSLPETKSMVTGAGANACFNPDAVPSESFSEMGHMHLTVGALERSAQLVRRARNAGATVSCDFNGIIRPGQAAACDLVFINVADLERSLGSLKSWDEAYRALGLAGDKLLVVTRGGEGAVVVSRSDEHVFPAVETTVVDATGGGDALIAGFIFDRTVRGASPGEALKAGLKLAAAVVKHRGVRPREIDPLKVLAEEG